MYHKLGRGTYMKIFKRNRFKVMMLTVVLLVMSSSTDVFAANTEVGVVAGVTATANSNINSTFAQSSTSASGISTYVSATYSYIDVNTLQTGTSSSSRGYYSNSSVSFNAPTNCRSVNIKGSHEAVSGNQKWSAKTDAVY